MGCARSKQEQSPVVWPLTSHSRQEWIAWRNCFLTYINDKNIPIHKQGDKFLEFIGNIGLDIAKNFYYASASSETDIFTLLFKFDVFFIFGNRKRHSDESVEDYIKALEEIAEKTAKNNTEKVIKEKILQDLQRDNIFEKFLQINSSFSKILNYEFLALHELAFIWEACEKPTTSEQNIVSLEARKRSALEEIHTANICRQCDESHNKGSKCKATGKKCWKCGQYNHFSKCCYKNYVKNCIYCSSNHVEGRCSAYGKECSRCKKMHHFSWQCFSQMTASCNYCGQSHISSRNYCPASNHVCDTCHKVGHFSFKCLKNRR